MSNDICRIMYWCDWGYKPRIGMVGMDGRDSSSLVTENLGWPISITIDYPNNRLYWVDVKLGLIESIRLDGTDRRVSFDFYLVITYLDILFVRDSQQNSVIIQLPIGCIEWDDKASVFFGGLRKQIILERLGFQNDTIVWQVLWKELEYLTSYQQYTVRRAHWSLGGQTQEPTKPVSIESVFATMHAESE